MQRTATAGASYILSKEKHAHSFAGTRGGCGSGFQEWPGPAGDEAQLIQMHKAATVDRGS
jgi:hypothetical protein